MRLPAWCPHPPPRATTPVNPPGTISRKRSCQRQADRGSSGSSPHCTDDPPSACSARCEPAFPEGLEPSAHRFEAPERREEVGVPHDRLQVPDRWIAHGVVLVEGSGGRGPPHASADRTRRCPKSVSSPPYPVYLSSKPPARCQWLAVNPTLRDHSIRTSPRTGSSPSGTTRSGWSCAHLVSCSGRCSASGTPSGTYLTRPHTAAGISRFSSAASALP